MQILKRTYNKSQLSILSKSLIIGGSFFILTGVLSVILCELFSIFCKNLENNFVLLGIAVAAIIIASIMSSIWKTFGWSSKNKVSTIVITIIYTCLLSITLGYFFAFIKLHFKNGYSLIYLSFLITGIIAFISGLISIGLNKRGAVSFGKFVLVLMIVMLAVSGVCLLLLWFSLFFMNLLLTIDYLVFILIIGSAFLSFCYLIIDILLIMRFQQNNALANNENLENNIIWYFGFRLFTDLISILLYVIYFLLRLKSPKKS